MVRLFKRCGSQVTRRYTERCMLQHPPLSVLLMGVSLVASTAASSFAADVANELKAPEGSRKSAFTWIPEEAPVPFLLQEVDIGFFVGARLISGDAWRGLPPIVQGGTQMAMGSRSWWVRPVVGYYYARGSGEYHGLGIYDLTFGDLGSVREAESRGTLTVKIDEINVGIGRSWACGWCRFDGATGAGWVRAQLDDQPATTLFRLFALADLSPQQDQDETYAWWSSLNISTTVGQTHLGVAGRYTYAPLTLFEQSLQAGSFQVGINAAWSW